MSRRGSSLSNTSLAISREINSKYDIVKNVADNLAAIETVSLIDIDAFFVAVENVGDNVDTAVQSAINADGSEKLAKKWAEELVDVEVEPGLYSAKHHATKASDTYTEVEALHAEVIDAEQTISPYYSDINSVVANSVNINAVALNEVDIDTVAGNISDVNNVAGNIPSLNTVSTNISDVVSVAGNAANITNVASNSTDIDTVATNISDVVNVSANIADVAAVVSAKPDIDTVLLSASDISTVSDNISSVNTVASDTIAINEVYTNRAEIYAADDNAAIATDKALLAQKWAEEDEDVEVSVGEYSAKHYSNKAAESAAIASNISSGLVQDDVVSTDTTYSSDKLETITQNTANDINTIAESIANLSSAQGYLVSNNVSDIPVVVAETQLGFSVVTPSTDTDVFEFDDLNNTFILKRSGSYNFTSTISIASSTGQPRDLSFVLRDDIGNLITSQTVTLEIQSGKGDTFSLNTLVVLDEIQVPTTLSVHVYADDVGMGIVSFNSTLSSMTSTFSGFADHSQLTGLSDPDIHPVNSITGLQSELDSKVDNSRVLTDVPAGALFTDTVYTLPSTIDADTIGNAATSTLSDNSLRIGGLLPSSFAKTSSNAVSSDDMNTFVENGVFGVRSSANQPTGAKAAATLVVTVSGEYINQTYTVADEAYIRRSGDSGATWSVWKDIINGGNAATADLAYSIGNNTSNIIGNFHTYANDGGGHSGMRWNSTVGASNSLVEDGVAYRLEVANDSSTGDFRILKGSTTGGLAGQAISWSESFRVEGSSGDMVVARLVIGATNDLSLATSGGLTIGATAGKNLTFDTNKIMTRSDGNISPLYINQEGGAVYINGNSADDVVVTTGTLNNYLPKSGNSTLSGNLIITGTLAVAGNRLGFVNSSFDAEIRVSDENPNDTGALFDFYGDGVSRNATLSAEYFDGKASLAEDSEKLQGNVVTTNRNDSTVGRIMRVGDFGVGASLYLADADVSNTPSGFYKVDQSCFASPPVTFNFDATMLQISVTGQTTQLLRVGNNTSYSRADDGAGFGDWLVECNSLNVGYVLAEQGNYEIGSYVFARVEKLATNNTEATYQPMDTISGLRLEPASLSGENVTAYSDIDVGTWACKGYSYNVRNDGSPSSNRQGATLWQRIL